MKKVKRLFFSVFALSTLIMSACTGGEPDTSSTGEDTSSQEPAPQSSNTSTSSTPLVTSTSTTPPTPTPPEPVIAEYRVTIGETSYDLVLSEDSEHDKEYTLGEETISVTQGQEIIFEKYDEIIRDYDTFDVAPSGDDNDGYIYNNVVSSDDEIYTIKETGTEIEVFLKLDGEAWSYWISGGGEMPRPVVIPAHTLHIGSGEEWVDKALTANSDSTEYFIQSVVFKAGDTFKIKMSEDDSDWRGYEALKLSEEARANFEEEGTDHNIKVKTAGTYSIYVKVAADTSGDYQGKSIWIVKIPDEPQYTDYQVVVGENTYDLEPLEDELYKATYYLGKDGENDKVITVTENDPISFKGKIGDEFVAVTHIAKEADTETEHNNAKTGADGGFLIRKTGQAKVRLRVRMDNIISFWVATDDVDDLPDGFYLKSNLNNWAFDEGYQLTKNESKYSIDFVAHHTDQFKIAKKEGSSDSWIPQSAEGYDAETKPVETRVANAIEYKLLLIDKDATLIAAIPGKYHLEFDSTKTDGAIFVTIDAEDIHYLQYAAGEGEYENMTLAAEVDQTTHEIKKMQFEITGPQGDYLEIEKDMVLFAKWADNSELKIQLADATKEYFKFGTAENSIECLKDCKAKFYFVPDTEIITLYVDIKPEQVLLADTYRLGYGPNEAATWSYENAIPGTDSEESVIPEGFVGQMEFNYISDGINGFKVMDNDNHYYGTESAEGAYHGEGNNNIVLPTGEYTIYFKVNAEGNYAIFVSDPIYSVSVKVGETTTPLPLQVKEEKVVYEYQIKNEVAYASGFSFIGKDEQVPLVIECDGTASSLFDVDEHGLYKANTEEFVDYLLTLTKGEGKYTLSATKVAPELSIWVKHGEDPWRAIALEPNEEPGKEGQYLKLEVELQEGDVFLIRAQGDSFIKTLGGDAKDNFGHNASGDLTVLEGKGGKYNFYLYNQDNVDKVDVHEWVYTQNVYLVVGENSTLIYKIVEEDITKYEIEIDKTVATTGFHLCDNDKTTDLTMTIDLTFSALLNENEGLYTVKDTTDDCKYKITIEYKNEEFTLKALRTAPELSLWYKRGVSDWEAIMLEPNPDPEKQGEYQAIEVSLEAGDIFLVRAAGDSYVKDLGGTANANFGKDGDGNLVVLEGKGDKYNFYLFKENNIDKVDVHEWHFSGNIYMKIGENYTAIPGNEVEDYIRFETEIDKATAVSGFRLAVSEDGPALEVTKDETFNALFNENEGLYTVKNTTDNCKYKITVDYKNSVYTLKAERTAPVLSIWLKHGVADWIAMSLEPNPGHDGEYRILEVTLEEGDIFLVRAQGDSFVKALGGDEKDNFDNNESGDLVVKAGKGGKYNFYLYKYDNVDKVDVYEWVDPLPSYTAYRVVIGETEYELVSYPFNDTTDIKPVDIEAQYYLGKTNEEDNEIDITKNATIVFEGLDNLTYKPITVAADGNDTTNYIYNNSVLDESVYKVRNDATAKVYLKHYTNGTYSFWITGGEKYAGPGYYLAGKYLKQGVDQEEHTYWMPDPYYRLLENPASSGKYTIDYRALQGDEFKIVQVNNDSSWTFYPTWVNDAYNAYYKNSDQAQSAIYKGYLTGRYDESLKTVVPGTYFIEFDTSDNGIWTELKKVENVDQLVYVQYKVGDEGEIQNAVFDSGSRRYVIANATYQTTDKIYLRWSSLSTLDIDLSTLAGTKFTLVETEDSVYLEPKADVTTPLYFDLGVGTVTVGVEATVTLNFDIDSVDSWTTDGESYVHIWTDRCSLYSWKNNDEKIATGTPYIIRYDSAQSLEGLIIIVHDQGENADKQTEDIDLSAITFVSGNAYDVTLNVGDSASYWNNGKMKASCVTIESAAS